MSKKETVPTKLNKTPWYKKAITPWVIILTVAVFVAGLGTGWIMRTQDQNRVESHAKELVSSLESK